ncbi:MAG: ATP-grasp domain-containing protein [Candidatus Buchananbacteria bacterium]|nr:ATP-grasp domain-containing protein [Candidatus Buchananbacteria bacterium]
MKHKTIKIGLMPGGIDGLVIERRSRIPEIRFKFLVPRDKAEAVWAKKFLPQKDFIFYDLINSRLSMADLDLAGVAKKSNLSQRLKTAGVTHLLVHHGIEPSFYRWAQDNGITLIAPDFRLAKQLEDKIWFDNFLAKNNLPAPLSQIIRPGKTALKLKGRVVLQEPSSRGGEGTYFVSTAAEIKKLISAGRIIGSRRYLARMFVPGQSYGITIFVSPSLTALSALRRQQYGKKNRYQQKDFLGIQWVGAKEINSKLTSEINSVFYHLGECLRRLGFVGYANIDFIATRLGVKILEANPRLAASSCQLVLFPETISQINTGRLYLEAMLSASRKPAARSTFAAFPRQSNFYGATVYIQSPQDKFLIRQQYPGGVYVIDGKKIRFVTPDITKISRGGRYFIFYSDTQPGEVLAKGVVLGTVISNFRLYDHHGQLNKYGKMILQHFTY